MAVLILGSIPHTKGVVRKRVLYDRTHDEHYEWFEKTYYTDVQIKELLENNGFDVTIYTKGPFTYEILQDYDAVIICVPRIMFTETEIDDLTTYVRNGGGLFVLGTRSSRFSGVGGIETILNPLSQRFGITYTTIDKITTTNFLKVTSTHEITIGVKEVRFEDWTTVNAKSPAEVLLTLDGFGMIASASSGFGKAIFSADDAILTLDVLDNEKLSVNILNWISMYGGPYRYYQRRLASANSIFDAAMRLYGEGNMEKARDSFSLAKGRFESLYGFYKTGEHVGKIGQCENYIKQIDAELAKRKQIASARALISQGRSLFEAGELLQAQQILQSARDTFQSLNMTNEYAEASNLLSQIDTELARLEEEKQREEEERQRQEEIKRQQEEAQKQRYYYIAAGGGALLLLAIVAVYYVTRGRKPKRREIVEERKTLTRKYLK